MLAFRNPSLSRLKSVVLIMMTLLLSCSFVRAQTPTPSPTDSDPSIERLRQSLSEVEERLRQAPPPSPGASISAGEKIPALRDSLRRQDISLRRLITIKESEARLLSESKEVESKLAQVLASGLSASKPYSVGLLDNLQAELDLIIKKAEGSELSNTAAKTSKELESNELKALQAVRRRLLDEVSGEPKDFEHKRRLERLDAAIKAAQNSVELAEAEINFSTLELNLARTEEELIRTRLALVQDEFRFSRETLETQLAQLENARNELSKKLNDLKSSEATSLQRLDLLLNDDLDDTLQASEIEARREWVLTHQRRERLAEEHLEFNLIRRDLWERRYLAHAGENAESYDEWIDSAQGLMVRLQKNRDILNTELSQIRTQLAEILNRSNTDGDGESFDNSEDRWADVLIQALVARQKALEEALNYQLETESLARRLVAELKLKRDTASMSERISRTWTMLKGFWNIELYTLGDSAVTVGKLSGAIFVLLLGLAVTGRFTRLLSSKFLIKLPIKDNVRVNLERFLRYFFHLLVFLFALHVVNIPLTIFTFLGGTFAIAIGFGAQNVLNNFISGLILMVERPVRIGDLIEVNDTTGFVEEIGARSTRIRIPIGIHVIVPNSTLLENKVTNWTLVDKRLRVKVELGVAYGSPTQKVMALMTQACAEQDAVHKVPTPIITFDDFANSSLRFSAYFWVTVASHLERDLIMTAVRLRVDELFAENDITLPFPQRDLNFNQPVPVRIIQNEVEDTSQ